MTIELYGSRALVRAVATAALGCALGALGCGREQTVVQEETPGEEDVQEAEIALDGTLAEGQFLFDQETFGGNGRTCVMCHRKRSGTLNPEQVQEVFDNDPLNALFKHDGSDDFLGNGSTRIRQDATILVRMKLPPSIKLATDPTATAIVLRRGIPTVMNTPALDTMLMLDGRGSSLTGQANGAIRGHAQAPVPPTAEDLGLIVNFEQNGSRFFSSNEIRDFAENGTVPELPEGNSPAQIRGRKWFVGEAETLALTQDSPRDGLCALCHSGPLLNQTSAALQRIVGVPAGTRLASALVSELNEKQNPYFTFVLQNLDGSTTTARSPDPGRALIDGTFRTTSIGADPADPNALPSVVAKFKIPILWGVRRTSPYFHDNSAATLDDVVAHYTNFFAIRSNGAFIMTDQDRADLVAFLKLL